MIKTTSETEALIKWLEELENLKKTKKGSRVSKKQISKEVVGKILIKPEVKVDYKYDNLLKSYHEAVKLNSQSGWDLSMDDLDEGKKTLQEKLLSQCPFFFHLKVIFGDYPIIQSPIHYDSGVSNEEAAIAVEGLLTVIGGDGRELGEEEQEGNSNSGEKEGYHERRRKVVGAAERREGIMQIGQEEEEEVSLYELDIREDVEAEGEIWENELLPDSNQ
ncbi:hypothetical protein L873DRAFT_1788849 [Choiromyces venosus 120613-1]|uniref:Uncharacterized protein n=1 Tax=Choiromyces venosus 120613-1 TaxID=1336337 RepID=A0A3N4JV01_9PEZI|nr:hypothetical protein L873DRAFT_1788849 [Choiromyces venosus 120613-1]